MNLYTLEELVTKDNIHQLADYLDISISKLREYMCTDVLVPFNIQEKIRVFFNLDGYLMYSHNSVIREMQERVSAKEAILLADKISDYILFYRRAVINGRKSEETCIL